MANDDPSISAGLRRTFGTEPLLLATESQAHTAFNDSILDTIRTDATFGEYLGRQSTDARLAVSEVSTDLDRED